MRLTGGQIVVETLIREGVPYIVLTSSGNVQAQWFQEAMVYEPKTNLTTGGFSTMGWTVPATLGAEFLRGDTPISPDLSALARALGCHAERISTPGEVRPALERAFAAGAPGVIEVMVKRTYPLSGSPAAG